MWAYQSVDENRFQGANLALTLTRESLAWHTGKLLSRWTWQSTFRSAAQRRARGYRVLDKDGVAKLLKSGVPDEITIDWADLARLYKLIRQRKPLTVLEFGCGFSSLVILAALERNGEGHLHSVDASEHWLANTGAKLPSALAARWTPLHSPVRALEINGQLCSRYERLPNVVPDFAYLDAPSNIDVTGGVAGLTFQVADGKYRNAVAANMLLYESTLRTGFFMLVDRRYENVHFLRHNLKRRYRVHWDRIQHQVGFELIERTGSGGRHLAQLASPLYPESHRRTRPDESNQP